MILENSNEFEEFDDDNSEEGEQDETPQPIAKKRKATAETNEPKSKKKKGLFAPPTVAELNQLRETQNLFNSNLFRLQIEEILKEVTVKPKTTLQIKTWFQQFKKQINAIKPSKEYELNNLKKIFKKLSAKFPLPTLPSQERGFFKYLKPNQISIIGNYQSNCVIKPEIIVDINIEIPIKCFHKTDSINAVYLQKRALYLTYIASQLETESFFTYHDGNILKPVLKFKLNKHVSFHVHTSVEKNLFKNSKFNPLKSNIRSSWLLGEEDKYPTETPFYNSCVLQDLTLDENEKVRFEVLKDLNNVQDGLKLLQVWLKQRELSYGYGAFTPELMAMFVVYLVKSKKINNAMSSYQVIRNVWINLAESKWTESGHGITLSQQAISQSHPTLQEFHECYPVVFIDTTGFYNLASFVNPQIYLKVKEESKLAMQYLDDAGMNSFRILFTTKMPFYLQYDQVIHINPAEINYETNIERHHRLDYVTYQLPPKLRKINEILRKGLNTRVTFITPKLQTYPTWSTKTNPPKSFNKITIGLKLNPENAFNVIDIGPPANLPEAAEFRDFWGEKSQIRRFMDGKINEACVWAENANFAEKRMICKNIVEFLLKFKLGGKKCDEMGSDFDVESLVDKVLKLNRSEELIAEIVKSFDGLSTILRSLKDLPLQVSAVHGCSNVFRYTEVLPGLAKQLVTHVKNENKYKREVVSSIEPFEAVIHLELSNKWPNNLEALQKLKTAFYIKIARILESQFKFKCLVHPDYIDIKKDTWIFRIRIANNKEISLHKKIIEDDGVTRYRDTDESLYMEKNLIQLPTLTSALSGLQSQHISFGGSARLVKLWLRSQLIDDTHIPDIVVDLIVASLYTSPQPYEVPALPQVGFFRFLQKMATSDWNVDPLVVNFNEELDATKLNEADSFFNKNRTTLPPLFIITSYDQTMSVLSKGTPSKEILLRIAILAKEALNVLEKPLSGEEVINVRDIFNPSISGYDVRINLKPLNHVKLQEIDSSMNLLNALIAPDFHQLYLQQLRQAYDDFALFFHNTYGGNSINVLWKPKALETKEFKVSHINGRKLVLNKKEVPELVLNKDAIMQDFAILGTDIVNLVDDLKN